MPARTRPKALAEQAYIAALFVARGGAYFGLAGVDPWDESRDARRYAGPWPVVAHPPCSTWCQLARINEARYGHAMGADGGCFASALSSVRRWGGVLEHPAESLAWPAFALQRPSAWGWQRGLDGSWVCEVAQRSYGHRARKRTWLYAVVPTPPAMRWGSPRGEAMVSWCKNHGGNLPRLGKKEAKATPEAFRDALIKIARGAPCAFDIK